MRVVVSTVIAKPASLLFELSQDYGRRLEWDTYLSEARLLGSARQAAVGVDSHCKSRAGVVMVSRYISYAPPTHAAVEMVSGPAVFQRFGGTWRFRSTSPGVTEVQFLYNFKVKAWALGWVVEPVMAWLYRRNMDRRVAAFKAWAENRVSTGAPPSAP